MMSCKPWFDPSKRRVEREIEMGQSRTLSEIMSSIPSGTLMNDIEIEGHIEYTGFDSPEAHLRVTVWTEETEEEYQVRKEKYAQRLLVWEKEEALQKKETKLKRIADLEAALAKLKQEA